MALAVGTRLGPYEIVAAIGAGGMREVYRARDTKLHRDVAIKVLLPAVANDPERLARFRREAQVLASLNHPNIAQVHGIEDATGVPALVMELVEGPTLAERIEGLRARGTGLPLIESLVIAKQIADALEAAHEQGIVHRDLKPTNIKVRDDGTVKVLDFGLAKAIDPASAAAISATMSPTLSMRATQAGIILGTAAYMSPEQTGRHARPRHRLVGRRAVPDLRRGRSRIRHLGVALDRRPEGERVRPDAGERNARCVVAGRSLAGVHIGHVGQIRDLRPEFSGARSSDSGLAKRRQLRTLEA